MIDWPKTVLEFSGGKDSLACLLYLREHLDEITVLWGDSGDAFPETHRQMDAVSKLCRNFVVVKGCQPEIIEEYGYPVDVLPMRCESQVQELTGQSRPKLQSFMACCYKSIMEPVRLKAKELGFTTIVRGQKLCDAHRGPLRNGDIVDGVTYWYPIEAWSDQDVMAYIADSSLLPAHYACSNTSMDCMHCTAYIEEDKWKLPYLRENYPEVATDVLSRLVLIENEIDAEMKNLRGVIHGTT
jgi:3'-phosphoadenosine 5'-phosphosulfate sulfotransferase (PAPS reductase)/FAD synthetase